MVGALRRAQGFERLCRGLYVLKSLPNTFVHGIFIKHIVIMPSPESFFNVISYAVYCIHIVFLVFMKLTFPHQQAHIIKFSARRNWHPLRNIVCLLVILHNFGITRKPTIWRFICCIRHSRIVFQFWWYARFPRHGKISLYICRQIRRGDTEIRGLNMLYSSNKNFFQLLTDIVRCFTRMF